jgi:hypothetical protein
MIPARRLCPRLLAGLVLSLPMGGCATWRSYDAGPGLSAGQPLPYYLRATRADSSRLVLTAPFVRADTLHGRRGRDRVAVPVAEIVHLERQRVNPGRTAAVVVGVPAVALGVTYLMVCGSHDCNPGF